MVKAPTQVLSADMFDSKETIHISPMQVGEGQGINTSRVARKTGM